MVATIPYPADTSAAPLTRAEEDFLARLTQAAYAVALRHKFQGPFLDVQLELWSSLRTVLADAPRPAAHR